MAIPLSREVQVNLVYRWFLEDRSAKANIPGAAGPVLVTGARVGVLLPRHPGVAAWPVPERKLIGVQRLGVGHARCMPTK